LVKTRVPHVPVLGQLGLIEEILHLLLDNPIGVIYVIYERTEMIFTFVVSGRNTLKFFHVGIIEVFMNSTLLVLGDAVEIDIINSWLIIVLTKACI
jgi:hypothetical protein|tara:strand:- start:119 stop:406 length:288 start_codon:yes stop_codon:yes gene_type:complete